MSVAASWQKARGHDGAGRGKPLTVVQLLGDPATADALEVDCLRLGVDLLDLYRGPQVGAGKKSFAVRLVLRSSDSTLTEADVDRAVKRIEGRLLHQLGATLRG